MNSTSVYLLEIDLWNGTAVETVRLSTHSISTRPGDTPPNAVYRAALVDVGQVDREISIRGGGLQAPTVNPVEFGIENVSGRYDPWVNPALDYGLDGRAFRLKRLTAPNLPVAGAETLISGTLRGLRGDDALKRLTVVGADNLALLNRPLLTEQYAGTTLATGATAEGDEGMAGTLKPIVIGAVEGISPKLANKFDLVYQVSTTQVISIAVYDGGLPLAFAGNVANLSQLVATVVGAGQYLTCLATGMFKLGASPQSTVTCDVLQGTTAADRSAARTCQAVLAFLNVGLTVDATSFDAFHTFNPNEVGIFVDSDVTALDVLGRLAGSALGTVIPDVSGVVKAVWLVDPQSVVASITFTLRDIGADGSSFALTLGADDSNEAIPAWRVIVNWGVNWTVMNGGDVVGAVDPARRALLTDEAGARQSSPAGAQSAAILTRHPLAVSLTCDTLLRTQVAADAQAVARFNLFKVKRGRIIVPIAFERASPEIGTVVQIKDPGRTLFAAGRNYLVVGRKDDMDRQLRYLTLWG